MGAEGTRSAVKRVGKALGRAVHEVSTVQEALEFMDVYEFRVLITAIGRTPEELIFDDEGESETSPLIRRAKEVGAVVIIYR